MPRVPVRLGVFALILAAVFLAAHSIGDVHSAPPPVDNGTLPVLSSRSADGYTLDLTGHGTTDTGQYYRFTLLHHDGMTVTDFDEVRGATLHAFVSRPDLSEFAHLTPKVGSRGAITVPVAGSGPWHIAIEARPKGGDPVVLAYDVTDSGAFSASSPPAPVEGVNVGDIEVIRNGWAFTVINIGGGKVSGLESYLGHGAHLIAIRERDLAIIHLVSTDDVPGAYSFGRGIRATGTYRVFLQFRRDDRVVTVAFTVVVS